MKSLMICQYCGKHEGRGQLPLAIGQYTCFSCTNRLIMLETWSGERYKQEYERAAYHARMSYLAKRLAA